MIPGKYSQVVILFLITSWGQKDFFFPHIPTWKSVSFMIPTYELHQEDSVSWQQFKPKKVRTMKLTSKEHELLERSCKSRLSIQP